MTGPPERRSVHLFQKNMETQYTLEKVENQKKKKKLKTRVSFNQYQI